ncbi:MAG: hypothetical protein ACW98Y_15135, partial [Candidatus Thorarchaeota archaeon]
YYGWPGWYDFFIDPIGISTSFLSVVFLYWNFRSANFITKEPAKATPSKPKQGFRIINSYSTITLVLLLLTSSVLIQTISTTSPETVVIEPEEDLWSSIQKYESEFVTNSENRNYGYIIDDGYPMYLFMLGQMYTYMYLYTSDSIYYNKLLRIVDYLNGIQNDDHTWTLASRGTVVNLYNALAAALFLNLYNITEESQHLDLVKNAVYPLAMNEDFLSFQGATNNDEFRSFSMICEYVYRTGDTNQTLLDAAINYYTYAISQYNETSGKWYYDSSEQNEDFYDGHSAFYQLSNIELVLMYRNAISYLFPTEFSFLDSALSLMISTVLEKLSPNATFYYKAETPDYTESAANVLVTLELVDQYLGTDYDGIKSTAIETILGRQLSNGAYLRTSDPMDSYKIWYTDNIGLCIMQYLYIL